MTCSLVLALALAASRPPPKDSAALERLATEVSSAISKGFEPPLAVYVEGAPAPLERAFASLLASRLAARRLAPLVVDAANATQAEQLARERGARSLLRLSLSLDDTRLLARGDALSTWVNFWSGAVPTRSGPAQALSAAVDLDAQVLALADRPPLKPAVSLELTPSVLARLPAVPSALAVGDLDGDHHAEVVVLSGEQVVAFDSTGRVLWRADLGQPPAAQPTREAFGAIALSGGKVSVWSAKRERPESFGVNGKSLGAAEVFAMDSLSLRLEPGFNRFARTLSWAGKALTFDAPPQALSVFGAVALVVFPDGTASLPKGVAPTQHFVGVGTGSTLADLDGDGTPEVVVSSPRTAGATDDLRVLSLATAEALQGRAGLLAEAPVLWQQALAGRALLAASGDLDGDGQDEVVLGTWLADGTGELVVLRRVRP